jgi:hypothetical protein
LPRSIQITHDGLGTRNTLCYIATMVRTLEKAIAEVSNLPDADQEQIGQQLLSHVEKLRRLRAEIDKGARRSLRNLGLLRERRRPEHGRQDRA